MSGSISVTETNIASLKLVHRGKVRDVYEFDSETLLLVATDRISAFDCVMPTPIPLKGTILTQLSSFWFSRLSGLAKTHLINSTFDEMPASIRENEELRGRSTLVKRTNVFPVECVVRGYLAGSGWKDYQNTGTICGHRIAPGLSEAAQLPSPIFTPATKAATGHDENITEELFMDIVGNETGETLKTLSLMIYQAASEYARSKGIIIADTKFEFGLDSDGQILLIDEVLTPDSSRFWSFENYATGQSPPSFDKQFVRNYLETLEWDKQPPAPALPEEIVRATQERYLKAYELLTGKPLNV